MRQLNKSMKPQDVVILFKILALENDNWQQTELAEGLKISQSEISQSVFRSKYSGLLDQDGKKVMRLSFFDFLQYGLTFVFPQRPGALVRGIPTAHSAPPLNAKINSSEIYVWPYAKGTVRGQAIDPLFPSIVKVVLTDEKLYHFLALADALRVGKSREKNIALNELKKRILNG